jgi:hypothetical protein
MLATQTATDEGEREAGDGLSLEALKKQFSDYASVKTAEIDEARASWRYYHTAQWTKEQLDKLAERGQPAITFDRVSRKIDGLVGIVQKLRTDPKGFPRTPQHAAGADLATAVLRYVLDASQWIDIERDCVRSAAVHGVGVLELGLAPGDEGDPDVTVTAVDSATFFYDPRSLRADFGDARFMGVSRFVTASELDEMFPGASAAIDADDGGDETNFDADRAVLWVNARRKIRLVEHWYRHRGEWRYCIYTSTTELASGASPFVDEKRRTISRYVAWSNNVDHDGDRYGFVRRLKGPQDAINQHRSKAIYIMNTRQLIARRGTFGDIEKARREIARPDGVIEYDGSPDEWKIEQGAQEFLQQTQYFEDAKQEIENFGPSPALVDAKAQASSGRALAMLQQNGLAEIGPFLGNYRAWKMRVYRAVWNAVRTHWQAERLIRVTDDEGAAQFIQVNALRLGPQGLPQIVNQLGALDVDIILDEGPDTVNVMGDVFDTILSLAQNKAPIPPQVIIELSPLPKATKDKILKMLSESNPMQQQAQQLQLAGAQAKVQETQASAGLKQAQAMKAMADAGASGALKAAQGPNMLEASETAARVRDIDAAARLKGAQTAQIAQEIALAPHRIAMEERARFQPPRN